MQEAKPLDQGITFSTNQEEESKPAAAEKKSAKVQEIENKWKDVYSEMGDVELEQIVARAEAMTDSYEFSDKVRKYTPIKNKKWREMTAKRRQWQAIQSKEDNSTTTLAQLEDMINDYYAEMCNIYYGMNRDEYDELTFFETTQAVEVGNHKTLHPLKAKPRSTDGSTQG